jgi:hypothetical protein
VATVRSRLKNGGALSLVPATRPVTWPATWPHDDRVCGARL